MNIHSTILLWAVCVTGNPTAHHAGYGIPGDTLTTVAIEAVAVQARYHREIVPAQSLSGDQLRRLGSHSVADALRYFSGVQIKDYGGIGGLKTVNIRSVGSQHVGVFYDGIQISDAQNGTVDLGKFSLDNMEVLSVYNGQKSDIFQSARDYASASALYMVTRKPVFEGRRGDNLNVKLKAGSFDLINASALWEHRFNGNLSSSANVEAMNTSGKYKFRYRKADGYDTTQTRRNGDVIYFRAEAALFGKIKQGDWQAKAYFYNSDRGYPGAAVKEDYEISLLNEDRQKDRNFFLQGSLRQDVNRFYSYKVNAKYARDYTNYVMPLETTRNPTDTDYNKQEVYLSAANFLKMTRWLSANLSADLQWNRLDAEGDDMFDAHFVRPRRFTALGAAAVSVLFERFSLQGSVLYTYVGERSARGMAVADDKNIFTPTAIASYTPFKNIDLNLRAFYKKIFRMPTFNDLYYVQLGNRLLKPEYTTQYNIGVSYGKTFAHGFLSSLNFTADAYYNEVRDKIIATPTSNQLVWTMVNLGYVEIRGVDATFNPNFRIGHVLLGPG